MNGSYARYGGLSNRAALRHQKKTKFILLKKEDFKVELNISEIEKKVRAGTPLCDQEFETWQLHVNTRRMAERPAFDFAEIEAFVSPTIDEGKALAERNARWMKNGPSNSGGFLQAGGFGSGLLRREDCKPAPASSQPSYMGPFLTDRDGGGVKRMLDRFFARLAEVRATGKLI
jgi:hypothetical protein